MPNNEELKNTIENLLLRFNSGEKMIKSGNSVPTYFPKTFFEMFYAYESGGVRRLYVYINATWVLLATPITDHGGLSGLGDDDHALYSLKSNVLELDNTDAFTPDANYEPATKKYVDDNKAEEEAIRATMWHDESTVLNGNALLVAHANSNMSYSVSAYQNAAAQNDEFSNDFTLKAGSYDIYILGVTEGNKGIATIYIDDVSQGTQDWYSGSTVYNVIKSTAITVSGNGKHTLKIKMAAKNGSSSNYGFEGIKFSIK